MLAVQTAEEFERSKSTECQRPVTFRARYLSKRGVGTLTRNYITDGVVDVVFREFRCVGAKQVNQESGAVGEPQICLKRPYTGLFDLSFSYRFGSVGCALEGAVLGIH